MYIKKVSIENIKCFGPKDKSVDIDLERPDGGFAGWTVIAGRNGSGKSTFLQSIALAIAGPYAVMALQESFSRWVSFNEELGESSIELILEDREKSEMADFMKSDTLIPYLGLERILRKNETGLMAWDMEGNAIKEAMNKRKGPWALDSKNWFIAGYGPFRRLPANSFDVSRKKNVPLRVEQLVSLFKEEVPLLESVAWLKEVYLHRLEKRPGAAELEESVLALLGDGLLPGGLSVDKIDSDGLWVKREDSDFTLSLNELSDGYRTVAALVLDIVRQLFNSYGQFRVKKKNGNLQVDYPGVVLIDEMDTHLHVSWQQEIGFWLKRHFPRIQFIVSTHSPFICQAADPKGLIKLPGLGEPGKVEHVSERLFNIVTNGTADEAVLTELFGLDRPYSSQSDKIRDEIACLEAAILEGKADTAQKKRYEQLKKQLPDTQRSLVQQALRRLSKDS
ncbi:MAG: AAA family ATPase [bacterium]|nr:AAA family ATPase [bacterium]